MILLCVAHIIKRIDTVKLLWGGVKRMDISEYTVKSNRLPREFDGFRIAHVSDFHNDKCASALVRGVAAALPDIIAITGDMVHREREWDNAKILIDGIKKIAPAYFVTGNHEHALKSYGEFSEYMRECGVRILENETVTVSRGGGEITVMGLHDPTYFEKGKTDYAVELDALNLKANEQGAGYKILLCHRPELFYRYAACGIDLVLCGHTHGGHVRFPVIGALYAPGQGLFPKYSNGKYTQDQSTMIVSRGLGKSRSIPRVLNPPELVIVTLVCEP